MAALALIAGVGLPWILGIALLRALPGAGAALTMPGSIAWTVGAGWFAGALLLVVAGIGGIAAARACLRIRP